MAIISQENERGKFVEHLIDSHNLILLIDSVHTRFDTYHQTSSLLDTSLCHPSIYMDVACEVLSDRWSSHYNHGKYRQLSSARKSSQMKF